MNLSRFTWYWGFVVIVTSVCSYGCVLALNSGLIATALFILVGSIAGVLMMTYMYRNG